MPIRTRNVTRPDRFRDSLDHREAGANRPFGIVLMGLRVPEINQHAITHVFGDEAIEPGDGVPRQL